jgi:hypothetical protein
MVLTYDTMIRPDPQAPWASGFLCIGEGDAAKPLDPGMIVSTRLRLLAASEATEALTKAVVTVTQMNKSELDTTLRSKVIELAVTDMLPVAGWLREGRMPEPGAREVLAGSQTPPGDRLSVSGETLKVVGVLQPSVALLADSYIAPAHESMAAFFSKGDVDVRPARLIRLSAGAMSDRKRLVEVVEAFPPPKFSLHLPRVRPALPAFLAYLGAQALFLVAGSGFLISIYRWAAQRNTWALLKAPLAELAGRPRLLWGVHLVYFGLFLLGALLIYELPDVQTILMSGVQKQIADKGNGVLAIAGRAYGTGNILYAAAVTFLINFFAGSLGMITIPSMIIPGCGALLATLRASLWGILLGPSDGTLARMMLPHTGTLLLEGGGYILAVFFAVLIPMYLFGCRKPVFRAIASGDSISPGEDDTPAKPEAGRSFLETLGLNLQGNLVVAMVLAVAACYEAVEVILMAGF